MVALALLVCYPVTTAAAVVQSSNLRYCMNKCVLILFLCCRLFPLREQGLNFYAHELTQDEIKVRHKFKHIDSTHPVCKRVYV